MPLHYASQPEPALRAQFSRRSGLLRHAGSMLRRVLLAFSVTIALPVAAPAVAQERRDHERARAALEAGQIRPLSELLAVVERRYMGRVIEADLERDDGQWLYEFKILPLNGRVFTVEIDAATGNFLRGRGPVQERTAQDGRPSAR